MPAIIEKHLPLPSAQITKSKQELVPTLKNNQIAKLNQEDNSQNNKSHSWEHSAFNFPHWKPQEIDDKILRGHNNE